MKKIFRLTLFLVVLLVGSACAWDPCPLNEDKAAVKQTKACLDKLNALTERWQEANLAGNEKRTRQLEHAIINTLIKNLNAGFQAMEKAEKEKQHKRYASKINCVDDGADFVAQRVLLNGKQALLYRLKTGDSFSAKLLALTDYQRLLRRELGIGKVELTENPREVKANSK